MFHRKLLLVGVAALVGLTVVADSVRAQEPAQSGAAVTTAGPQRIELTVYGLSCPFCAYGLEKKLKKVEGLDSLHIDFKAGQVTMNVRDGSKASDEQIEQLVKDAGFSIGSEIKRSPLPATPSPNQGRRP